jgi:hypothetical protein
MFGGLIGMLVEGVATFVLLWLAASRWRPARPADRHPRLHPQRRRDHLRAC